MLRDPGARGRPGSHSQAPRDAEHAHGLGDAVEPRLVLQHVHPVHHGAGEDHAAHVGGQVGAVHGLQEGRAPSANGTARLARWVPKYSTYATPAMVRDHHRRMAEERDAVTPG